MSRSYGCLFSAFGLLLLISGPIEAQVYAPLPVDEVKSQALNWVAAQEVKDKSVLEKVGKLWASGDEARSRGSVFDSLIETFAVTDPESNALVSACRHDVATVLVPEAAVFKRDNLDQFHRANLSLFFGRYLAHRQMYEEALEVLAAVQVEEVVDPASYLFFRAVCEHSLLKKSDGLATLDKLLEKTSDVPTRYSSVAKLMLHDLQALREKSLDEVARKMSDVERRLELGRGGQKVQKIEDEIVATLDEIIEKLEQQQGGGGGNGSGNSNNPANGAQDSVIKGSTAPGQVDKKKIGTKSGWGALPPKKEAQAKNLINRKFPAHYGQAIKQYLKKLAKRRASPER